MDCGNACDDDIGNQIFSSFTHNKEICAHLKTSVSCRSFDNVFLKNQDSYPHWIRFFLHDCSESVDLSTCGILIVAGSS